jgi:hypothetical protein
VEGTLSFTVSDQDREGGEKKLNYFLFYLLYIGYFFLCLREQKLQRGRVIRTDRIMSTSVLSSITQTLSKDMEFEFSLDFQGQVEYIQSETTDEFLERELVILWFVDKGHIPINERTEGLFTFTDGVVEIVYKTCTEVGVDWDSDVWEEGEYTTKL